MSESLLSQDEIDALLQGADDSNELADSNGTNDTGASSTGGGGLSPTQQEILGELVGGAFNSSGSSLGALLGERDVKVNYLQVSVQSPEQVRGDFASGYISVSIPFTNGITGDNIFLFYEQDAIAIANELMGGGDSPPDSIDDALLQSFQEPMGILVGSVATQLGQKINKTIQTEPPEAKAISSPDDLSLPDAAQVIKISYNINVSNLVKSQFFQIIPYDMGMELSGSAMGSSQSQGQGRAQEAGPQVQSQGGGGGRASFQDSSANINPVKFPGFQSVPQRTGQANIDLLMDVPMTLTVELGRAKMMIKDILALGEGSIIELDKLAGEPVDLLVNGKLIGKGEVVVIDENFGVRVTDIVTPLERVKQMGGQQS